MRTSLLIGILAGFVALAGGVLIAGLPESAPNTDVRFITTTSTTAVVRASTSSAPAATTPARAPSDTRVLVINASGQEGAAGDVSQALTGAGYDVASPGNSSAQPLSVIYFRAGFEGTAPALVRFVPTDGAAAETEPLPATLQVTGVKDADIVVMIGRDYDPGR